MDGYIADGYGKRGHHCPEDAAWYSAVVVGNNTWSYATAGGKLIGSLGQMGPSEAAQVFRGLPEAERKPEVKHDPDSEAGIADLRPPKGGLVARAYGIALDRTPQGGLTRAARLFTDLYATSAGCVEPALTQIDMLWLTQEEAASLVPANPKVGSRSRLPEVIQNRMLASTIPKCGPIGETGELTLVVTEIADGTVSLRLEGFSRKGPSFDRSTGTGEEAGKLHEGQVLRFLGFLKYETHKRAFSRFDIVAIGEAWGETVNRAHGSGAKAEPRRWPVGFAFELAKSAADRITPPAIVQNALYNGGFSERYWGR